MNARWYIKTSVEALDSTIKDLRNNQNRFGGIGDFRQTLPVIPWLTPVDEHNAFVTFDRTKSLLE